MPKRKQDQTDAVELAERHFPGTACWFDSPIWEILKGAEHERWALQRLLLKLSPSVVDVLITMNGSIPGQAELARLTPGHFDRLVKLGNFDAIVATAIMAKLSEETASTELRDMALSCYALLQPILADAPETCEHYPELFTYMDKVCQYWILLSPGKRLIMHLMWHGHEWALDRVDFYGPKLAQLSRANGWGNGWEKDFPLD